MELFFNIVGKIESNKMLKGDTQRDANFVLPESVTRFDDISYGPKEKDNLLCVNIPAKHEGKLPCIISVHGGGYFYGTKETYQYYCADLATRGFAVINFNYSLTPKYKFPTQLEELNQVICWIRDHCEEYDIDINNLFLVGDSVGAQMVNHYTTILTNPEFAKFYDFKIPMEVHIRAVATNSGMYDILNLKEMPLRLVQQAYIGREYKKRADRINVMKYMTKEYLPNYIATAPNDYVRQYALPQFEVLKKLGVECYFKEYGNAEDTNVGHVFHLNIALKEAKECNNDECEFFRKHIQ